MGLLSKAATGALNNDEASQGGLLKIISEKHPPQEKKGSSFSTLEKAVMEKLSGSYAKFGVFQGVIMETFKSSAGEFTGRLSYMVSGFGAMQNLVSGRVMILFNSSQDGELIGKHIEKALPGNNIFSFQANSPQEAFSFIKPYL